MNMDTIWIWDFNTYLLRKILSLNDIRADMFAILGYAKDLVIILKSAAEVMGVWESLEYDPSFGSPATTEENFAAIQ